MDEIEKIMKKHKMNEDRMILGAYTNHYTREAADGGEYVAFFGKGTITVRYDGKGDDYTILARIPTDMNCATTLDNLLKTLSFKEA